MTKRTWLSHTLKFLFVITVFIMAIPLWLPLLAIYVVGDTVVHCFRPTHTEVHTYDD